MGEVGKLSQVGLGVTLRELRENNDMSTRSVASALGLSPSSVNRTELGRRPPSRDEVSALCALYGVTGEEKRHLVERCAETVENSAWLATGRVSEQLASLMILEREAATITDVEMAVIPGLAQTGDYARLLMGTSGEDGPDLEGRVATRLGRQAALSRPRPPAVTFVIDEAVLFRTLQNPRVVREQLEHLLVIQKRDNVSIRLIPLSAPAHPALDGSFSLYELPNGAQYVFVEARYFGVFLTEPGDVNPFVEVCRELDNHTLDDRGSGELIEKIAENLSDE